MHRATFASTLLAILMVASASPSLASPSADIAMRPADTSSPRATLKSFIESANEIYQQTQQDRFFDRTSNEHHPLAMRLLDCLDLNDLPEYERAVVASEAAICIKEILDRVELPPEDEIPDVKMLENSNLPGGLSQWRVPGTRITITRVEEGPNRLEYLFSPGTVGRASEYFQSVRALPYRTTGPATSPGFFKWYVTAPGHPTAAAVVDRLPNWWRMRTAGLARWKWLGLIVAIPLAIVLMVLAYRLQAFLVAQYRDDSLVRYSLTLLPAIFATFVPIGLRRFAYDFLTVRGDALYVLSFIANLVALVSLIALVFGVSNRITAAIIASPQINPHGMDAQFVRIISRLLSVVVAAIVFLEGGRYLGIPLSTLLTSAGIGGLAIALAAQDTMKNLFGTIMLLMDKPFRVGERIIFGKYDGVVEDIGLRSTKLRLLTGHQAIVPNDELARTDIENVGRRQHIRRTAVLELPAVTPSGRVKKALEIVRTALADHEGMQPTHPPRVYLRDFNEKSLGIFFIYWYHPPEYWDFLAFSERVNLQIIEQLEAEQIAFSAPVLTINQPDTTE